MSKEGITANPQNKKLIVDIMKHSKQSSRPGFSRMQQKHAVGGGLSFNESKTMGDELCSNEENN